MRPPGYRSVVKPNGKIDYLSLLRETPRLMRPIDYLHLATILAVAVGASIADGSLQRGLIVVLIVLPYASPRSLRRAQPLDWIHIGIIVALALGVALTTGIAHGALGIALVVCCWLRARR